MIKSKKLLIKRSLRGYTFCKIDEPAKEPTNNIVNQTVRDNNFVISNHDFRQNMIFVKLGDRGGPNLWTQAKRVEAHSHMYIFEFSQRRHTDTSEASRKCLYKSKRLPDVKNIFNTQLRSSDILCNNCLKQTYPTGYLYQ